MNHHRTDHLVSARQADLARHAAEQRLARVATEWTARPSVIDRGRALVARSLTTLRPTPRPRTNVAHPVTRP